MERTNANGERLIDLHMNVLDAWVTSSLIFFLSLKKVLTTSEMNVNFKLETFILFCIAVEHSKGSQKLKNGNKVLVSRKLPLQTLQDVSFPNWRYLKSLMIFKNLNFLYTFYICNFIQVNIEYSSPHPMFFNFYIFYLYTYSAVAHMCSWKNSI